MDGVLARPTGFTLSPDQKGIETIKALNRLSQVRFTLSPDQKGIETAQNVEIHHSVFTLSPDQKGIETRTISPVSGAW